MSTLSKVARIVKHNQAKVLAKEPKVLLYVYQRMDHKPLNASDGIYSIKVGDHWCIFQDIYEAAKRRIREGLGCDKAALDDGRIKILEVFDVTKYAQHHNKYRRHSKIDLNVHKVIPGHYRDDNFHVNDISEVLALIAKEVYQYSTPQQKEKLKLSPFQHDLMRDSIAALKAGKRRQLLAAAARIGKTSTVLALMVELNLPFMVFASYITNSLNSLIQDAAKFAQFHNMLVVDTRKAGYQELIEEGLAAGRQVVALLSMCNGGDRQDRIDYLFGLDVEHTLVVDEADFGSHQPTQTEPLQAAVTDNELVIVMSGTNPERAMSTWNINFQYHINNQDMQVARGLYLKGQYKKTPSKMLLFKKDYSKLGTIVPVQCFQMTLKKLQDLAKIDYPEAFTDDDLWGSWIKWMKDPLKARGPLGMFFESVFEGKWNLNEVSTEYQFGLNPDDQRVSMIWLPHCTTIEHMKIVASIARKSLKNWDVILLSGGVVLPDGSKMTGEKAEREVNDRIASAKFHDDRNVLIISAIMGARSFGIKEITEVYLCYDEGAVGSTMQKMARALTPFFDGTEKLARIVSCSFDPNRDEKFDSLILECAKRIKMTYGVPLVDAIKLVLSTSDFFVMTQDGKVPYVVSEYLASMLARKSAARVFGKVFRLENIPADLLQSIANVSGKIGKTEKQEIAQRGKTFAEALKKSPGVANTPAQDKIWKDIRNGLVYIASNIDWIMCFGRRGDSLVECLKIVDKRPQRTKDGLAEDYGIPYEDLARLLRSDVSSHDLLELESYAGTGTASNRQKFSIDPVIEEMLNRIPEKDWRSSTTSFADLAMAGGQFLIAIVRKLRTYGHSDANIRGRVFGFDTCEHRILAAKYHCPDLMGTFETKTNEETMKMTQKFDVIVGNPPYQQNSKIAKDSGTNKLWNKFIKLAIDLSPGGYVAYITPQSFMVGNKTFDLLTSKKSINVNTEISHYFPGINSSFSAWVLFNKDNANGESGEMIVNGEPLDSSLGLIPKDRSHEGLSLVAKFFSKKNKFSFDRLYDHGSTAIKNDPTLLGEKSKRYQHPITFTASKRGTAWSRVPSPVQGKKKVIIFRSAPIKPTYSTDGVGADAFFKLVDSKEEGGNMVEIFNSKLYSYIFKTTLYSGFYSMSVFNHIPYLDYTRSWTDAEIYKHFNITKKEQAHIEAYLG